MPLYRTRPDISLDDLIAHLEWVGEEIISAKPNPEITFVDGGEREWVVITKPPRARNRPFTATDVTGALGQKETR